MSSQLLCCDNHTDNIQAIHFLISDYEHSISAAKLENSFLPPQTHLLKSKLEGGDRRGIPEKNSFATVQELELRELRIRSILDHGGFLLTGCPRSLGLTAEQLRKYKSGLKRAMYMSDRLADVSADPDFIRTKAEIENRVNSLEIDDTSEDGVAAKRDAEQQGFNEATRIIRPRQAKVLSDCSTVDLAFLLTLCEGAMVGWQRYNSRYATSDVQFYHKINAFGELVLRKGNFIIWAFVRGTGEVWSFATDSVVRVAEYIWRYELGFDQSDPGLTMALHDELKKRLFRAREEGDPCFQATELEGLLGTPPEALLEDPFENPLVVKQWAHKLVGKEIGCKGWKGYYAVDYP